MIKYIVATKNLPEPLGPYSQAVEAGNIVFISGQIPVCPNTNTIPESIYDQTYQALKNIKNIIENINLNINNIVKTTLFIKDINDLSQINDGYKQFFDMYSPYKSKNLPTRSCVEVSKLPKNAKIEIEAIAIRFNTLLSQKM